VGGGLESEYSDCLWHSFSLALAKPNNISFLQLDILFFTTCILKYLPYKATGTIGLHLLTFMAVSIISDSQDSLAPFSSSSRLFVAIPTSGPGRSLDMFVLLLATLSNRLLTALKKERVQHQP
jgi:hypothetical protein